MIKRILNDYADMIVLAGVLLVLVMVTLLNARGIMI